MSCRCVQETLTTRSTHTCLNVNNPRYWIFECKTWKCHCLNQITGEKKNVSMVFVFLFSFFRWCSLSPLPFSHTAHKMTFCRNFFFQDVTVKRWMAAPYNVTFIPQSHSHSHSPAEAAVQSCKHTFTHWIVLALLKMQIKVGAISTFTGSFSSPEVYWSVILLDPPQPPHFYVSLMFVIIRMLFYHLMS